MSSDAPSADPHNASLPPGWKEGVPMKTYTASCHCKRFVFTFEHPDLSEKGSTVMECNCSICRQKGLLYLFTLDPTINFTSDSKLADMTSYLFNKKYINQRFCPTCGCQIIAHADGMSGVNARAVEGLNFEDVERMKYDGANL